MHSSAAAGAETSAGHGLHFSCSPLDEKCSTWRQRSDIITGSWEIVLLLIKSGRVLGMFNCPPATAHGPWVRLIPGVWLVWEGQRLWERPAGRAVLH